MIFRIRAKARVEVASMCPRLKPGVNEERKLGQVGSKCLMCFGIGAKVRVKGGGVMCPRLKPGVFMEKMQDAPQADAWGY